MSTPARTPYRLDVELSREIAQHVDPEPKGCYINTFRAMSYLPPSAQYVEGFAIVEKWGFPTNHGWALLEDGVTVVDVSWYDLAPVIYHPLQAWTMKKLLKVVERSMVLPAGDWQEKLKDVDAYMALLKSFFEEE
jgi:hypothetical protein